MKRIYIIIIEADGAIMKKNNQQNISVILRTKNEEKWIGHTIQSLLDNINNPEIIVINNNSSDDSIEIVNNFKHDNQLKKDKSYTNISIYKIDKYTPGKALNLGVKKSKNDVVLIISSHCVLKNINIKKHINDLEKYVCIFGKQNPIWKGKRITKRYIWSHFVNKEVVNMYSKFENRYFLHNGIALYQKKYLLKNPFNESLTGKEDRYWAQEVIKNKKSFLYDPIVEADHHYTTNGNTWKGMG